MASETLLRNVSLFEVLLCSCKLCSVFVSLDVDALIHSLRKSLSHLVNSLFINLNFLFLPVFILLPSKIWFGMLKTDLYFTFIQVKDWIEFHLCTGFGMRQKCPFCSVWLHFVLIGSCSKLCILFNIILFKLVHCSSKYPSLIFFITCDFEWCMLLSIYLKL